MNRKRMAVAVLAGFVSGSVVAATYTLTTSETWDGDEIAAKAAAYSDVTVGSGLSLTFNVADGATVPLVLTGAGDIVKEGDGTLTLTGVNTFTGELKVNDGVLKTDPTVTFAGTNLGSPSKVTVADGAALDVSEKGSWDDTPVLFAESPVYIAGTGHDGQGAIRRMSGSSARPVFKLLHLTDDATVVQGQTYKPTYYLDGHAVTLSGSSGLVDLLFGAAGMHPGEKGSVVLQTAMNLQGDVWSAKDATFEGTADNVFRMASGAKLTISRKKSPIDWSLLVEGDSTLAFGEADQPSGTIHPEYNTWAGPVTVTNKTTLKIEAGNAATLANFSQKVCAPNGGDLTFFNGIGTISFNGGISLRQSKAWDNDYGRLMTTKDFSGVARITGDSDLQAFFAYGGRVEFREGAVDGVGGGLASFYLRSDSLSKNVATLYASNATFNATSRYFVPGDMANTYGVVDLDDGTTANMYGFTVGYNANAGGAIYHRAGVNMLMNGSGAEIKLARVAGSYAYYGMSGGTFQNNGKSEWASAGFAFFRMGGGTYKQVLGAKYSNSEPTYVITNGGEMVVYQTGGTYEARHKFTADTPDGARMLVAVEGTNTVNCPCGAGWYDRLGFACTKGVELILAANDGGAYRALRLNRDKPADCTSRFYFSANGGVIQPTGSDDFFESGSSNTSGPDAVYVHEGGLTLDTTHATGDMNINEPFYGPVGQVVKAIALPADAAFADETYISPAKVTIAGSGTGAAAVALFDEKTRTITGIKVVAPGSGYEGETTATIESADRKKTYACAVTMGSPASTGTGLTVKGPKGIHLRAANTFRGPFTICEGKVTLEEPSGLDTVLNEDAAIDVRAGATINLNTKERTLKVLSGSGTVVYKAQLTVSNELNLAVGSALTVTNGGSIANCRVKLADGIRLNVANLPENPDALFGKQTLLSVANGRIDYLGAVDLTGIDREKWSVRLGATAITVGKREGMCVIVR